MLNAVMEMTPVDVLTIESVYALSHAGLEYQLLYLIYNIFPHLIVLLFSGFESVTAINIFTSSMVRSLTFHLLLSFCACYELHDEELLPPGCCRLHEFTSFFSLVSPFYIDSNRYKNDRDSQLLEEKRKRSSGDFGGLASPSPPPCTSPSPSPALSPNCMALLGLDSLSHKKPHPSFMTSSQEPNSPFIVVFSTHPGIEAPSSINASLLTSLMNPEFDDDDEEEEPNHITITTEQTRLIPYTTLHGALPCSPSFSTSAYNHPLPLFHAGRYFLLPVDEGYVLFYYIIIIIYYLLFFLSRS
jgi:hypothetical protein